jgi:hypothetical protein
MADVEPKTPIRRRTPTSSEAPSRQGDRRYVEGAAVQASVLEEPSTGNERRSSGGGGRGGNVAQGASWIDPGVIALHAASLLARLSGRRPESVISIDRKDEEWCVGVEVVEMSRIPDSTDILAVFEVRLDTDGDLISYRRLRRYARGQLDWERQR